MPDDIHPDHEHAMPQFVIAGTLEAQAKLMTELALARLEFDDIEKDRTGQYGYQTFKYATLGMLTAATLPALAKHGIAVMQAITNSPVDRTRQRITTMLCGHGARIESPDFDPRLTSKDDGKGEAIKEYGKLRTYLRRYDYQTLLMLDAEPDADEAGVKAPQEPQKRREAPRPPEPRSEPRQAAQPRPAPQQAQTPTQYPGHFTQGQLQSVPQSPPKSDPLAEKLSTPVTPLPATDVAPSDDGPASEAQQAALLDAFRASKLTKIQFGTLCMDAVGVPSNLLRDSAKLTAKMIEVLEARRGAA